MWRVIKMNSYESADPPITEGPGELKKGGKK